MVKCLLFLMNILPFAEVDSRCAGRVLRERWGFMDLARTELRNSRKGAKITNIVTVLGAKSYRTFLRGIETLLPYSKSLSILGYRTFLRGIET